MVEYRLFDNIIEKEAASSFVSSVKELLTMLNIEAPVLSSSKQDVATEGKSLNEEAFLYSCAYNLAKTKKDNADLICVEDSSYTSLNIAKLILLEDSQKAETISTKLQKAGLELSLDVKVLHVNEILSDVIGFDKLTELIKRPFDKFNIAIFNGNKTQNLASNDKLLSLLGAKIVNFSTQNDSDGYEILSAAPSHAKRLAGKVMLDMFDNAADFVVTNDARSFYMFDSLQKSLEVTMGRDIELSVFSSAQIVLLALGYENVSKMGLDTHKRVTQII